MSTLVLPRTYTIPEGHTVTTRYGLKAEVYEWTKEGKPYAKAFRGMSNKPVWFYNFKDETQRANKVAEFFDRMRMHEDRKAADRAAQTNVNFYQVLAVPSARTVIIREIGQKDITHTQHMAGHCMPAPGVFSESDQPMTKRVSLCNHVRLDRDSCSPWHGRPVYWSSYA